MLVFREKRFIKHELALHNINPHIKWKVKKYTGLGRDYNNCLFDVVAEMSQCSFIVKVHIANYDGINRIVKRIFANIYYNGYNTHRYRFNSLSSLSLQEVETGFNCIRFRKTPLYKKLKWATFFREWTYAYSTEDGITYCSAVHLIT